MKEQRSYSHKFYSLLVRLDQKLGEWKQEDHICIRVTRCAIAFGAAFLGWFLNCGLLSYIIMGVGIFLAIGGIGGDGNGNGKGILKWFQRFLSSSVCC